MPTGMVHYFNAELLQVEHRMSCPAPRTRLSTTTKPGEKVVNAYLTIGTVFGNGSRSGPSAVGAAKRDGPSIRRGHGSRVMTVCDRFVVPRDGRAIASQDRAPHRYERMARLGRSPTIKGRGAPPFS
jgi:hypothetical protein